MDLDASIAHLEFSKAQTKDEEKKWRPTKETVNDQIRPAIVKELTKRKNLLQRQMDYQNGVIEQLIMQVEQYRRQMREQAEKRQQIVARMENDKVSLRKVDDQLAMIHEVLNSKSVPMEQE
jgi:predicted phage tail protein